MTKRLDGKVVFLTGGSEGIGRAAALRIAAEGAHLAVAARRAEPLASLEREIRDAGGSVETFQLDVSDTDAFERAIFQVAESKGQLDGLVNNAFSSYRNSILDTTLEAWRRDFAVNCDAVFIGTRAALRVMYPRRSGSIVNIASTCGLKAMENMATYSASKAALVHFSNVAAMEAGPHNVRVNVVAPGQVATESLAIIHRNAPDRAKRVAETIPMRRSGEPAELANVILFLLTDESSFVNGATIPVDGGKSVQLYAPPAEAA